MKTKKILKTINRSSNERERTYKKAKKIYRRIFS